MAETLRCDASDVDEKIYIYIYIFFCRRIQEIGSFVAHKHIMDMSVPGMPFVGLIPKIKQYFVFGHHTDFLYFVHFLSAIMVESSNLFIMSPNALSEFYLG